jgi:hypothetical protein
LQVKESIGSDWTLPCAALQAGHAILPSGLLSLELNLKERQRDAAAEDIWWWRQGIFQEASGTRKVPVSVGGVRPPAGGRP